MKYRRSGRIVTIASGAPWSGEPGHLHYTTAMSALVGMNRSLARELGDFDISANMVCPDAATSGTVVAAALPGPVGAGSVVGSVLFFAGAGSEFITGQSYLVNGGGWLQ